MPTKRKALDKEELTRSATEVLKNLSADALNEADKKQLLQWLNQATLCLHAVLSSAEYQTKCIRRIGQIARIKKKEDELRTFLRDAQAMIRRPRLVQLVQSNH